MVEKRFEHRISKGSRFNQIYIPLSMQTVFEAGDIVEVKLLRKKDKIYFSKNLKRIGDFKEKITNEIFSCLSKFSEIKQIFIIGSFLLGKDYKDIDMLIIGRNVSERLERKIYNVLDEKIGMKFHILIISESNFLELLKIDPVIRSMILFSVSNKKTEISESVIDKKHLKFLLMMPEDLLKVDVKNGRAFYDNLRRVFAVERFLEGKTEDIVEINKEIKKIIPEELYERARNSAILSKKEIEIIRRILKYKLRRISEKMK